MEKANQLLAKEKSFKGKSFKFNKEIHEWLSERSPEYKNKFNLKH